MIEMKEPYKGVEIGVNETEVWMTIEHRGMTEQVHSPSNMEVFFSNGESKV